MIGPPLSVYFIRSSGYEAFFLFYSLIGAGAFIGVMTLPKEPALAYGSGAGHSEVRFREIFTLFKIPTVGSSYLGILLGSAFGGILMTYVSLYVERYTGIPNPAFFFTLYAGIGALSSAGIGRLSDRYGRRSFVLPSMLVMASGILLLVFLPRFPWMAFILSALLTGVGYHALLAIFVARVVDGADRRMKATALAFQESSIDLGISVGIFLFGLVSVLFSYPVLFAALACVAAAAPVLVLSTDGGGEVVRGDR
jgi:predicted MFS family arabinose efflux permease